MNGWGAACAWKPGWKPAGQRRFCEQALGMFVKDTIHQAGFPEWTWRQEGDTRTIELLGPDSPADYIYTIQTVDVTDATVQDTARDIYWWVIAKGRIFHGQ